MLDHQVRADHMLDLRPRMTEQPERRFRPSAWRKRRERMTVQHDTCSHGHHSEPGAEKANDPVCGMAVDPQKTQHKTIHAGSDYFFCSAGCRTKFEADPPRYLAAETSPSKAAPVAA